MNKLLNYSFRAFTIYAFVLLILSLPAYYFLVNAIWVMELDEHNNNIKNKIQTQLQQKIHTEDALSQTIRVWELVGGSTKIEPSIFLGAVNDSVFSQTVTENDKEESYRILNSQIFLLNKPYLLSVKTNIEESSETLSYLALCTFIFLILLFIGFLIINKILTYKLWKPFQNTLKLLQDFDLQKSSAINFKTSDIVEFNDLNDKLNKLINNNIAVYNFQKEFSENSSHELQTPIAVLKVKIDNLIQDASFNDQQLSKLAALQQPLTRIKQLNKSLLLLAKLENKQFDGIKQENIDVALLLQNNLNNLEDLFAHKSLEIKQENRAPCMLFANKELLQIVLSNLLVNAYKYSPLKSEISVILEQQYLQVSNYGNHTLLIDKLFKRFSISSEEHSGSGLGLAITKEICILHKWSITYSFTNNYHLFRIDF